MRYGKAIVLCLAIGATVMADSKPQMGPRPVYAKTVLVAEGKADCAMVIPDEDGYEALAKRIAAKIKATVSI